MTSAGRRSRCWSTPARRWRPGPCDAIGRHGGGGQGGTGAQDQHENGVFRQETVGKNLPLTVFAHLSSPPFKESGCTPRWRAFTASITAVLETVGAGEGVHILIPAPGAGRRTGRHTAPDTRGCSPHWCRYPWSRLLGDLDGGDRAVGADAHHDHHVAAVALGGGGDGGAGCRYWRCRRRTRRPRRCRSPR